MAYDLELPDGSTMTDIPDEVDPKEALSSWVDSVYDDKSSLQADPTAGMSTSEQFAAGVGKGMTDVVHGAGELASKGVRSLAEMVGQGETMKDFGITEADSAARDLRDAPLSASAGGGAGELLGETAALLPVGMGANMFTSLAAKGASKLPLASKAASRVLSSKPIQFAAEGAAEGAILEGDLSGAKEGALLGAGMGVGAGVLSKGSRGLIKKSDEAAKLEKLTGERLPVAMAAESEGVRKMYDTVLPFFPGTGRITEQVKDATKKVSEAAAEAASPSGVSTKSLDEVASSLKEGYMNSMGKRAFRDTTLLNTSTGMPPHVASKVDSIIEEYSANDTISGKSIHVIRDKLAKLVEKNPLDPAYRGVLEKFDKRVVEELTFGGKKGKPTASNQKIIDSYGEMNQSFADFGKLAKGEDEIGSLAKKLKTKVKDANIFQKLAANAVMRGAINVVTAGAAVGAPAISAGMAVAGRTLSNPRTQKILMGDATKVTNPYAKELIGRAGVAGRAGFTANQLDDEEQY